MAPTQYLLENRPAKPVMKMRVGGGQILWKDLCIRLQQEHCLPEWSWSIRWRNHHIFSWKSLFLDYTAYYFFFCKIISSFRNVYGQNIRREKTNQPSSLHKPIATRTWGRFPLANRTILWVIRPYFSWRRLMTLKPQSDPRDLKVLWYFFLLKTEYTPFE